MSKKAKKLYLELAHKLADSPDAPACSEPYAQEWFFPEGLTPTKGISANAYSSRIKLMELSAKQLCQMCPLKALCAEYALEAREEFGIWGGLTAQDRKTIYASARSTTPGHSTARQLFD